jgi:hypothetical protein
MSLRKLHKYISLVVSLQLLLWTVSGIYFSFNKIENVRGEQYYKAEKAPLIIKPAVQEKLSQESIFAIITEQTTLKPITIELKKGLNTEVEAYHFIRSLQKIQMGKN